MTAQKKKKGLYGGVRGIFTTYWDAYGRFPALLESFYLHVSCLLLVILYPMWMKEGWWDTVISIMPNMIGFSLAGLSIWLATGDENLKSTISGVHPAGAKYSPYIRTNASFVHFIIVQLLSLIAAVTAKAFNFDPSGVLAEYDYHILVYIGWGFGFLLFLYALATALAVTMSIFRVSTWYDTHQTKQREKKKEHKAPPSQP